MKIQLNHKCALWRGMYVMRLWFLLVLLLLQISACNDDENVSGPGPEIKQTNLAMPEPVEQLVQESREPIEAWQGRRTFKRDLIKRYGHARWLNLFGAQIWQESNWKSDALSWVGAEGCGQFMPPTQGDSKYWAGDLGTIDWSLCFDSARASIRYMKAIKRRIKEPEVMPEGFDFDCYSYTEAIKDYNRGMGNGDKERRLGYCVRNDAACEETEAYIYRIRFQHQDKFFNMKYGEVSVCQQPEVPP